MSNSGDETFAEWGHAGYESTALATQALHAWS